jgi:uncharacterized membrane protein YsdA (DUF1294 family)
MLKELFADLTFNDIVSYFFVIYEMVISVIAVIVTVVDKFKSRKHSWRISEGTLLMLGALGGALVMWITMMLIRHKTKHRKFMIGLPAILLLHIAAVYLILAGSSIPAAVWLRDLLKL